MIKKIEFKLDKIMFKGKDNGFTIARVFPISNDNMIKTSSYGNVSIKGTMCELSYDIEYECLVTDEEKNAYGTTYCVLGVKPVGMGNISTDDEMLIFIKAMIGQGVYDKLKNKSGICKIIQDKDVNKLIKIKGIGKKLASKIIYKWETEGLNSKFISELLELGFNEDHIDKITTQYEDLSYAVNSINKNPYKLILDDVKIRIDVIDRVAIKLNIKSDDIRRIEAYVYKTLKDESIKDFKSYIGLDTFSNNNIIKNIIYKAGQDKYEKSINNLKKKNKVVIIDDNIGLSSIYNKEKKLINNIKRIATSDDLFKIKNIDEQIHDEERKIGIVLTDKQREAVRSCISNNFTLIKGYAGTGKTTITKVILNILENNMMGARIKQCALSGKAAQVLSIATGREANTIHRLIDKQTDRDNKEDFYISADVLVIDELSMVDIGLFGELLKSVMDGVKVICMGDNNQLPSLAYGKLIDDVSIVEGVNTVSLTEVHRQALESGIIKTASDIRSNKFKVDGRPIEIIGNMNDMMIYSEKDKDFIHNVIEKTSELYDKDNKEKVQVICATSALCYNLNNEIQSNVTNTKGGNITVNAYGNIPKQNNKPAIYKIFEDDKIMIIKNMYDVQTKEDFESELSDEDEVFGSITIIEEEDKQKYNLYNGNIGTLKEVCDKYVIVDINNVEYAIEEDDYDNIQLAYACTCHKLQGSAAEHIIVYLSGNYAEKYLMCNEWIYTAITRSKKMCYLYGDYRNINIGVKTRNLNKKTTFMELLLRQ